MGAGSSINLSPCHLRLIDCKFSKDAEFVDAFNPRQVIELIKRLQEAEKELSALSDLLCTIERAADKGNLPHFMEDGYDKYIKDMGWSRE